MTTKQEIADKLFENRTAIIKNVIAAVLIFLILVIEGCVNFIDMEFHFEKLKDPSLWAQVGTKVLLLVLIKMACMFIFLDVARKTNKELQIKAKTNSQLLKLKGADFPYYCENIKNKEIKKEAFTKKIQKKLRKLEKHAKAEDRLLYFNDSEESKNLKGKNTYCIKRKELEEKLTDEYQEEHYQALDVKHYEQIDPAVFDMPIVIRNTNKYQLTAKTKMSVGLTIFGSAIILIFTQSIWNVSNLAPKEELPVIAITIGFLMDFIFISWQTVTGIMSAFTTINNQEVLPFCNRNRILKEYIFWKEPNKKENLQIWIEQIEKSIEQTIAEKEKEE